VNSAKQSIVKYKYYVKRNILYIEGPKV